MPILETIEWCDFWWVSTEDDTTPRVMLIGDSITKGYRPVVSKVLENVCNIDMLATSKALDNPAFKTELDYAFSLKKYDIIHFNNGLHGGHLSVEEYHKHLEDVILYIKGKSPFTKIIIATSTPITKRGNPEELEEKLNLQAIKRNQAVYELATKYDLKVNDLYNLVLGKSELSLGDSYHYNEEGIDLQGITVASILKDKLNII